VAGAAQCDAKLLRGFAHRKKRAPFLRGRRSGRSEQHPKAQQRYRGSPEHGTHLPQAVPYRLRAEPGGFGGT
jgi:hypothetical protein